MKKIFYFFAIVIFSSSLIITSCGGNGEKKTDNEESKYKLTIQKETFAPGEKIIVEFTADPTWDGSAWIGVIPSNTPHGKEAENDNADIDYRHLDQKASGKFEFTAPSQKGKFDIRMNDSDDGSTGLEITSVTFEVK